MPFDRSTVQVEYSTDEGTSYTDLGHIIADGSENSPEAEGVETSAGIDLYAGTLDEVVVQVADRSKYDALATAMKDDSIQGTIYLRFTDDEGNTPEVQQGYSVMVSKGYNFTPRQRNPFTATFKRTTV